FQYDSQYDGF
nr:RecName: Full=Unknown protein from spot P5 of 2D-PAGE of heart tissue [Rattus norvegicus]